MVLSPGKLTHKTWLTHNGLIMDERPGRRWAPEFLSMTRDASCPENSCFSLAAKWGCRPPICTAGHICALVCSRCSVQVQDGVWAGIRAWGHRPVHTWHHPYPTSCFQTVFLCLTGSSWTFYFTTSPGLHPASGSS